MKDQIDIKYLRVVLFLTLCFLLSVFFALVITPWLFIVSVPLEITSNVIQRKYLCCPKCGKSQSILSLLYAMNHRCFCYTCGEKIRIRKDKKDKEM